MFKITIFGNVDENEEYVKKILGDYTKTLAEIDDPLILSEMLLDACNTHPIFISVDKLPY